MSAPDILATMGQAWNRQAESVATGTERTGMSAALWTHRIDDVQEAAAEPHASVHTVCMSLSRHFVELRLDGRQAQQKRARPGDLNIIAAGVRPWAVHRGRWRVLHLYVPDAMLRATAESGDVVYEPMSLELIDPRSGQDYTIERIGREVMAEMRAEQPLSRLRVDALGQDLAIQLLRRWSSLSGTRRLNRAFGPGPARGGLAAWQQRRTTEYLAANLAEDVTLEGLARIAELSTFHFARQFKQSTGLTPHAFLRRLRCERAKCLLAETSVPVTEIAALVGYETSQAFARMFRAEEGISPTDYRRTVKS